MSDASATLSGRARRFGHHDRPEGSTAILRIASTFIGLLRSRRPSGVAACYPVQVEALSEPKRPPRARHHQASS